jgi:hypothetical protein
LLLHQESENSGKAPWIFGHHFRVVGMLAGITEELFCIPLTAELHEGALALRTLQGKKPPTVNGVEKTTVVTLMGELLATVKRTLARPCVAVLEAFFSAAPMFFEPSGTFDCQAYKAVVSPQLHLAHRVNVTIPASPRSCMRAL